MLSSRNRTLLLLWVLPKKFSSLLTELIITSFDFILNCIDSLIKLGDRLEINTLLVPFFKLITPFLYTVAPLL